MQPSTLYLAPTGADAAVLAAGIAERAGATVESVQTERRTVLDTFDWRVKRGGFALEHVTSLDGNRLVLRRWGAAAPVVTVPVADGAPSTLDDLPSGRMREQLAPLIDIRALVGLTTYDAIEHLLVVRNRDEKAVARIAVDDLGAGHVVVRCLPVRGYDRFGAHAAGAVIASRCDETGADPVEVVLGRAGRVAGDRGGKFAIDLDASELAAAGWVRVLGALLDDIEANVPGTLADIDNEFLHDLRVAVRRSRSALRHAKGVMPEELLGCFRPELRWLQEITGPARDLDVYVMAAGDDSEAIDAADRAALVPFHRFLAARRAEAHAQLDDALRSDVFVALLDDWRQTLASLEAVEHGEEAGEWGDWPPDAHEPLGAVAAVRIRSQHRKLLKGGRAVTDESPPEALHDLRKRGKELRYLLELFGSVGGSDPKRTAQFVKALKGLQDVLGEFQDTEVQMQALRGWADELAVAGDAGPATLLAMGELVDRLQQRQVDARRGFASRFERFAAAGRP